MVNDACVLVFVLTLLPLVFICAYLFFIIEAGTWCIVEVATCFPPSWTSAMQTEERHGPMHGHPPKQAAKVA